MTLRGCDVTLIFLVFSLLEIVSQPVSIAARFAAWVRGDEEVGAALACIPPCSPDLNPIELAFTNLQRSLEAAERRAVDRGGR